MRRLSLFALSLLALACGAAGRRNTGKPIDPSASERPPDPVESRDLAPGEGTCRDSSECAEGLECFAADFSPGRGTPPPCSSDEGCGEGRICEDHGCTEACTPESCPKGLDCEEDGHCRVRSCRAETNPTICARNHRCGQEGFCNRMSCKGDSDCDVGFCAGGRCIAKLGRCLPHSYCCPP